MSLLQVTSCGRQIDLAIAQDLSITLEDSGIGDSISIPVCDGSLTVTAADFSPLSLFQSGEQGVWYDPSDFSTMFQDSAGTTPVTAVGQAVGRIRDKSGRGNHATQATPTARPILRQDAGGRYYLEFDGTDDFLVTGSITPGADKVQVFAGVHKVSDAAAAVVVETSAASGSNPGTLALFAPGTAGVANYAFRTRGSAGTLLSTKTSSSAPVTNVVTTIGDISGDTSIVRVNGVAGTTVTQDQGTGNYLSYAMYIGSRAGSSLRFSGRIYGLIARYSSSNLPADSITNAETWMNLRTGAY